MNIKCPLESHLAKKGSIFFNENAPSYNVIYRELARCAEIDRKCDSSHQFVRLTEHKIDEDSYYILAINYSNKVAKTKITIADGYVAETVFGADIQGDILTLDKNDGALFKIQKNKNATVSTAL